MVFTGDCSYYLLNIEKFGFDTILAVFGPSIIAQSGAAFGVWLKTKDKRLKQIASPAAIMGFFGISEPAIYGITLKYRKAFACAVIGGGIGGAIAGSCGARAMAVAVAAVPTFLLTLERDLLDLSLLTLEHS